MTSKEIRQAFLSFFEKKGHQIVPSAPMVVKGDPTLMFTNAGMNQFKDIILGNADAKARRVADSQKCLRVSGKHNDLEEVGHDTYHHTMFEMLGNWSFGDYFKKEAIQYAWEFLIDTLGIDPANLYVTYFEGDSKENIPADEEAKDYWSQYLSDDHILKGNKKDNFWEMGDQGPCGPCSEIHIDIRSDEERKQISGRELVNGGHPQVIEIWNLVFMQYNRRADGSLTSLPFNVIDTGMGFERICMAIQGKQSNYDTDVFIPIIQTISTLTGFSYGQSKETDIAMRVIADHIRTIAFAIADGQLPSNAKAGYVIRRILRRAVRYGYTFLGRREAFMYALLPILQDVMGDAYPELIKSSDLIIKVIKEEEESFLRTLETGIRLLDKKINDNKIANIKCLSGEDAFILYDTYGFPLDLTALILAENGMTVDEQGFEKSMQEQRQRARNAASVDADDWVEVHSGDTEFVGYDRIECQTSILRYRKVKQKNKEFYQVVLSSTPFYAEMGGQVGDVGVLQAEDSSTYEVFDTKKENNLPIHLMMKLPADIDGTFHAVVNADKRKNAEANHTATHLLHQALREVLGNHVEQKGSFVSPDILRFDFSHFSKVNDEEIRKVERLVNERVRKDYQRVEYREIPIAEAQNMGAMALFGEKYGDKVRVLRYGSSIELCGGTHIASTGKIGTFKIISESSVAAGIRRIEAITGRKAEDYIYEEEDLLKEIKNMVGNNAKPLSAIQKLLEERDSLSKQIEAFTKDAVVRKKEVLLTQSNVLPNGISLYLMKDENNADIAKDIAFQLSGQLQGKFAVVASISEENTSKCQIMVMLSKELTEGDNALNASQIVKATSHLIKGGGGGQPHFATAGGKDPNGLLQAIDMIVEILRSASK